MVKMRRGESRSFNNWLRVRVIAQGLTIVAVVAGTYSFGYRQATPSNNAGGKSQVEVDLEVRREEKVGRERAAFEERLRVAEEMHKAEVGGGAVVGSDVQKSAGTKGVGGSGQSSRRTGWWGLGWLGSRGTDGKRSNTGVDSEKKS